MKKNFTLIELILVIAILGILAGLLIPQISQTRRTANMAATASNQARIAQAVQSHFVTTNTYPDFMDALLMGAPASAEIFRDAADENTPQAYGLPRSGPHLWNSIAPYKLNSADGDYRRSLTRCGLTTILYHDPNANTNSNAQNVTPVAINNGICLATIDSFLATDKANAGRIINDLLGIKGLPVIGNKPCRLFAFGFGTKNSALGTSVLQAPLYPGCDGSYYGHYIVVLCAYPDGRRATLAGVIDSYGRTYNYTMQQISESLPAGVRRD